MHTQGVPPRCASFSNNSMEQSQLLHLYYGYHTSRHCSDVVFQDIYQVLVTKTLCRTSILHISSHPSLLIHLILELVTSASAIDSRLRPRSHLLHFLQWEAPFFHCFPMAVSVQRAVYAPQAPRVLPPAAPRNFAVKKKQLMLSCSFPLSSRMNGEAGLLV